MIAGREPFLKMLNLCSLLLCVVGVLFGIFGELKNEACALFFLAVSAWGGGKIIHLIRLPELIGMLVVGMLLRFFLSFDKNVSVRWSSIIRDCALAVILLKAGLGLDPQKLSKLKLAVFKLSLIPCLSETIGVALFSRLFLGLPWIWSLMTGFILCAVSAAILVPGMMDLDKKRYGAGKGISTLMLAAVSVDNTVALTGFFVSMSIITSGEIMASSLVKKAVEPFVGLLLGGAFGFLLWWIPCGNGSKISYERALFLCIGGLNFIFLCKRFDVAGAGAMGCVFFSFVASLGWRQDTAQYDTIVQMIGMLWKILEVFLFGLIGIQVSLERLKQNLGIGVGILVLGILVRIVSTIVALCGTPMNFKERLFISLTWFSKATVQAAVGSIALEYFHGKNPEMEFGEEVLSLSVLSIVLTAPLGVLVLDHLGPLLLLSEDRILSTTQDPSHKVAQTAQEIAQIMHHNEIVL